MGVNDTNDTRKPHLMFVNGKVETVMIDLQGLRGKQVKSKTPAGVQMGHVPSSGVYGQKRKVTGVFTSGKIVWARATVTDYGTWPDEEFDDGTSAVSSGLGKVPGVDCLVKNDEGTLGWVGLGDLEGY